MSGNQKILGTWEWTRLSKKVCVVKIIGGLCLGVHFHAFFSKNYKFIQNCPLVKQLFNHEIGLCRLLWLAFEMNAWF